VGSLDYLPLSLRLQVLPLLLPSLLLSLPNLIRSSMSLTSQVRIFMIDVLALVLDENRQPSSYPHNRRVSIGFDMLMLGSGSDMLRLGSSSRYGRSRRRHWR
jgi:hypothetical protein